MVGESTSLVNNLFFGPHSMFSIELNAFFSTFVFCFSYAGTSTSMKDRPGKLTEEWPSADTVVLSKGTVSLGKDL